MLGSVFTAASLGAGARAQDIDDLINGTASRQLGDAAGDASSGAPGADGEPLSELEALSRSADDDAFRRFGDVPEREPVALTVRALNKVTAKFTDLTIAIDETVDFGTLSITVRYCDTRPPEEFPETSAFLQIADRNRAAVRAGASADAAPDTSAVIGTQTDVLTPNGQGGPGLSGLPGDDRAATGPTSYIFSGWMFASSPALNPLEHPVYDVWVITCETKMADTDDADTDDADAGN